MATSPKVVLVVGLSFAALCVLVGFMCETDADRTQVDAVNSAHWREDNMPVSRVEDAKSKADMLARTSTEISAVSLTYEDKAAVLMVPSPRMRWQRLLGLGPGMHKLPIRDPASTFAKRWEDGLKAKFGTMEGDRFVPFRGLVVINMKNIPPKSMNVLDYLDFAFLKTKR